MSHSSIFFEGGAHQAMNYVESYRNEPMIRVQVVVYWYMWIYLYYWLLPITLIVRPFCIPYSKISSRTFDIALGASGNGSNVENHRSKELIPIRSQTLTFDGQ